MARTGKKTSTPTRNQSPQVEVPGAAIQRLITLAAAEHGPTRAQLASIARNFKDRKIACDVHTAILLLEYSIGKFQTCTHRHCDDTIPLKEAIGGMVTCREHRIKDGSRAMKRKREVPDEDEVRNDFVDRRRLLIGRRVGQSSDSDGGSTVVVQRPQRDSKVRSTLVNVLSMILQCLQPGTSAKSPNNKKPRKAAEVRVVTRQGIITHVTITPEQRRGRPRRSPGRHRG